MTRFSLTFDSANRSLALLVGERVVLDAKEIHIQRPVEGGAYECRLVRESDGKTTNLLATSTTEGKKALAQAKGAESKDAPGFVEAPPATEVATAAETPSVVSSDIAKFFGCDA